MIQLLQELAAMAVLCVILLSLAIAEFMYVIGAGKHRLISAAIGSAVGLIVFSSSSSQVVAAIIVAGIVTIVSDVIITWAIAPKIGAGIDKALDKVGEKNDGERTLPRGIARDYHYILNGASTEERTKYLNRQMEYMRYNFTSYAVTVFQAFSELSDALENSGLKQSYPESVITSDATQSYYWIKVALPRLSITIVIPTVDGTTSVHLRLASFNKDGLKLKEMMDLDKYAATLLDWMYTLVGNTLRKMDNAVSVKIESVRGI